MMLISISSPKKILNEDVDGLNLLKIPHCDAILELKL